MWKAWTEGKNPPRGLSSGLCGLPKAKGHKCFKKEGQFRDIRGCC